MTCPDVSKGSSGLVTRPRLCRAGSDRRRDRKNFAGGETTARVWRTGMLTLCINMKNPRRAYS